MKLVPVPLTDEYLEQTAVHWLRFLPSIAKRSKEPVQALLNKVMLKQVQPILIWDETQGQAVALLGIVYHRRGDELIAELIWTTGTGRENWQGLLPDLERYLKDHTGCTVLRPICRPGWKRFLKDHGYTETHVQMEKVL
jgi:hypothetical protein